MKELLNYVNYNIIANSKSISKSLKRKLIKTFDFHNDDNSISGVLNYICSQKKYEVIISYDNNTKVEYLVYKTFELKDAAFNLYDNIYKILLDCYGEEQY